MDTTCLLLRHHPVPCLADNRCVCGPDGVPSCTAEVIDRHAFSARRVDLGFPTYLAPDGRHDYPDFRRGSNEIQGKVLEEDGMSQDEGSSSQELLIMSDNMCRFGSRWYGGSLRCFCDIDGSITCGDPTFVTAFIDNFLVQRQECEEGHVWEEGCSVCSCRRNGVIFCRRSSDCRHQFLDSEEEGDASDDDILGDLDHYLPVGWNHPSAIPEPTSPVVQTPASTSARVPMTKGTRRPALECVPGKRWHEGCARCHCSRGGRVVCSRRLCHDKDEEVRDEVSREAPQGVTDKNGNDVRDAEVTMWNNFPRGPRGPMMLPPRPASIYHPPAYMAPPKHNSSKCGKFDIGEKYWQDCNLCLCTRRGPKCQAKLCR
nr:hypothetical protein BaRGS_034154 [Batillaria attramentaria]